MEIHGRGLPVGGCPPSYAAGQCEQEEDARQDETSRLLDETGAEPAIVLDALAYGSDVASSCILGMQSYCRNRHGGIVSLVNHLHLFLRSMTRPTCGSCCAPSFHRVSIASFEMDQNSLACAGDPSDECREHETSVKGDPTK